MKLVYIAGPYRDSRGFYFSKINIDNAEKAEIYYLSNGYSVFCPHKCYGGIDGAVPEPAIMASCMEVLKRSDIVVMLDGWQDSVGARAEHDLAKSLCKEIVYGNHYAEN